MTRYRYRKDKEGFAIPSGVLYRLACCDCGLVHDIVLVSDDGKDIGFAACRNERATAARRRGIFEVRESPDKFPPAMQKRNLLKKSRKETK